MSLLHFVEILLEIGLAVGQGQTRALGLPIFLKNLSQFHCSNAALRLGNHGRHNKRRQYQTHDPKRFVHKHKGKQNLPRSPTSFWRSWNKSDAAKTVLTGKTFISPIRD